MNQEQRRRKSPEKLARGLLRRSHEARSTTPRAPDRDTLRAARARGRAPTREERRGAARSASYDVRRPCMCAPDLPKNDG